jgi:hypothetical protein
MSLVRPPVSSSPSSYSSSSFPFSLLGLQNIRGFPFFLRDCWLKLSMCPEGPTTSHLERGFLAFLPIHPSTETLHKFQVPTVRFTQKPPYLKSSKVTPLFLTVTKLFFSIMLFNIKH